MDLNSYVYFNNLHGIVAEDIYHFNCQLSASRFALMEYAF